MYIIVTRTVNATWSWLLISFLDIDILTCHDEGRCQIYIHLALITQLGKIYIHNTLNFYSRHIYSAPVDAYILRIAATKPEPHTNAVTQQPPPFPIQPTTMNPAVQHSYIISTKALCNTTPRRKTSPERARAPSTSTIPKTKHTKIVRNRWPNPVRLQPQVLRTHSTVREVTTTVAIQSTP